MKIPLLLALVALAWLGLLIGELAQTVGQAVLFWVLVIVILLLTWFCGWCAAEARHARRHPALPPRQDGVIERAFQKSVVGDEVTSLKSKSGGRSETPHVVSYK